MKYIRTKNNRIYEAVEEYNTTYLVKAHKNYRNIIKAIDGTIIVYKASCIKVADTIEELCDEFVSINEMEQNKPKILNITFESIKQNDYLFDIIYGAIWTDKGLIYVAKMNDKGELELL